MHPLDFLGVWKQMFAPFIENLWGQKSKFCGYKAVTTNNLFFGWWGGWRGRLEEKKLMFPHQQCIFQEEGKKPTTKKYLTNFRVMCSNILGKHICCTQLTFSTWQDNRLNTVGGGGRSTAKSWFYFIDTACFGRVDTALKPNGPI